MADTAIDRQHDLYPGSAGEALDITRDVLKIIQKYDGLNMTHGDIISRLVEMADIALIWDPKRGLPSIDDYLDYHSTEPAERNLDPDLARIEALLSDAMDLALKLPSSHD